MVPDEYAAFIGQVVEAVGDRAIVSVHTHDDLGMAEANSLAALGAGARQIECTINGIGERAGNCALEEVVMAMAVRNDQLPFHTGIRNELLYPCSQLLGSLITFGPQPNKAIVGANAFAHEAGIHQDGYLKNPLTYEIMRPEMVGSAGDEPRVRQTQRTSRSARKGAGPRFRRAGSRAAQPSLQGIYGTRRWQKGTNERRRRCPVEGSRRPRKSGLTRQGERQVGFSQTRQPGAPCPDASRRLLGQARILDLRPGCGASPLARISHQ